MNTLRLVIIALTFNFVWGHSQNVVSGPMVGYVEAEEVLIWLQTDQACDVHIEYYAKNQTTKKYKSPTEKTAVWFEKESVRPVYIAKILLKTEPSTEYHYEVFLDKKKITFAYPLTFRTQSFWHYRKDPQDFTIALGSCFFVNDSTYDRPGKSYGGNYEILQSIYDKKPHLMLWLGDNTYLREPDFFTVSGMLYRYTHTRSLKELQPLLANCAHYAIWDDHDYGPNDSDRSFKLKNTSQQIFERFWANPNPVHTKSYYTSFTYEDCEFFLLDNRYFRTPNKRTTDKRSILGEEQLQWLIDGLVASKANFKFVCVGGQVLNTAAVFENYATFEEERKYIIETIQKENIKNVIFLTGDRHHSELSATRSEPVIYDFTVSPLTAGPANFPDEKNDWRIPNSYIGIRNFGLITVTGKLKERTLTLQIFDTNGKELWKYSINLQK